MRYARALLMATMICAASVAVPVRAGQVTALTNQVIVTARQSGYSMVELPRDVPYEGLKARLAGDGRLVGFALIQDEPGTGPGAGAEVYSFKQRMCDRRGCSKGPTSRTPLTLRGWEGDPGEEVVPAGVYRLYVITDGEPVRVELTFPGLERTSTALRANEDAKVVVSSPKTWYQESSSRWMMSAGEERPFAGRGLTFLSMWHRGSATAGSVIGDCEYIGAPPPPEVAYMPGCPAAQFGNQVTTDADSERYAAYRTITYSYVPRAIGMYYVGPGSVEDSGVTAMWLTFKP